MKRLFLSLALLATVLYAVGPALATEEDGPVVIDGITFESMSAYVNSEYFQTHGKRCGLVIEPGMEGEQPLLPGTPADCGYMTNPADEYEPLTPLVIPVVVHNITNTSNVGYLSDALIQSQIVVLNEDYQAIPGSNGEDGYDTLLQFELATVDPDGNPTTGIEHVANDTWFADGGAYWNVLAWDPTRYLNIYTNNPGSGILGYVPWLPHMGFPGTPPDRVVIYYRAFGSPGSLPPYHLGRTTTHEVGHYLGEYHTFQDGCGQQNPPGCYQTGDRICDTLGELNAHFGCPLNTNDCGNPDPIRNYMDYTDDICMTNFTHEQARRIRCTLTHYRPDLGYGDLTAVPGHPQDAAAVALYQNVPNPFNPKTSIRFELAASGSAGVQVLDVAGRVVRSYALGELAAGGHELSWNGQDDQGRAASSGVYFYRLSVDGQAPITKRMVLMK
jgi:hypothetical protein